MIFKQSSAILLISVFSFALHARARNFYVSPQGTDNNNGLSQQSPFSTIGKAARQVEAGDTVFVLDGTYHESVYINRSGTPSAWIIFLSINRHGAKIIPDGNSSGFSTDNASYIEINGFEITQEGEQPTGVGISADFGHHTRFLNNHIHHCGGSGIQANHGDYRIIENNVLHHNAFWNYWQMSGISLWQAVQYDDAPGFHNILRSNISYSNENRVPGPNGTITDGNGIIIDDFKNTQYDSPHGEYRAQTLVENNICFDNGMKGIHTYLSGYVTVRNNIVYWNNRVADDSWWRGELNNANSDNNRWYNNIAWTNPAYDSDNNAILDAQCCGYVNENVEWKNNLTFNGSEGDQSVRINNSPTQISESDNNLLGVNPLLAGPSVDFNEADFRPLENSPAVDAGHAENFAERDREGNLRPSGSRPDIGAYEYIPESVRLFARPFQQFPRGETAIASMNSHTGGTGLRVYDARGKQILSFCKDNTPQRMYSANRHAIPVLFIYKK